MVKTSIYPAKKVSWARGLKKTFRVWLPALVMSLGLLSMGFPVQAAQPTPTAPSSPIPSLAYYYIWYDTSSWSRAKVDYPLLGRYSSDDASVMLQHIQWAKAAGITGFIVSWKGTATLDSRLDQLVKLADQQDFKLAIIYEGLDFSRNPLPVAKVANDLDYFIQHYATDPAFQLFSKPMVIWSGTWMYSTQDVATVTSTRRDRLLILASEKSTDGYNRLANLVDGDAYYWSSVNPATNSGYQAKLTGMSTAIHQNGGLWIAPAAPGFNAQAIGGTSNVDRNNGTTFRTEINAALGSSPDALGIISWNEFSENSYIEPSQAYGSQYLDILSSIDHMPAPAIGEFDSSLPSGTFTEVIPYSREIALGGVSLLAVAGVAALILRRSRM